MPTEDLPVAKSALRASLGSARAARSDRELDGARAAICALVLARARSARWSCVAAYEPLRTEPGSVALLAGLVSLGVRVIVPVTLPSRDLDWAPWTLSGRGDPLGVSAIAVADAVFVPALAVATDGTRLGRGGGSYDRALPRAAAAAVVAALLFDGEVLAALPHEPWDQPVTAVVTPAGWMDL